MPRKFIVAALVAAASLHAEDPLPDVSRLESSPVLKGLKKNPIKFEPKSEAEKTVAQMYVPEGFRVDLVLAEPDLHQPVAFAFDERGRIWVAEAHSYPTKRPKGEGLDKLIIFEDADGDGKFESRKVFAEKLNLVSGFEVGYGGVWVGAAPELLFIPDRDRDDKPDSEPQVLLDGFGYQDTHECLNSFIWGPDGWLYGIQGVFNLAHIGKPGAKDSERTELRAGVWRYHPVRHQFEVFAHGGSNPWGLDYDEHGQFFMTHCRSYWGGGGTTHVIQGAQFWNQANANYAPYIIADAIPDFPNSRNFLLASAQHDHGAGGAGARGTDAIYGGHSHVGTMIYYGDNWPDEYRGQLFTHNLGGHQINRDINERHGSGYKTVHAATDVLFCTDPKYVAVDLQYGPDGAVYFIDWYDQQHCHNPNTERWDRTNGRMYRMVWEKTYKPKKVDLTKASFAELVENQNHKNQWFGRTSRRVFQERYLELEASKRTHWTTWPGFKEAVEQLRPAGLRGRWMLAGLGLVSSSARPNLKEQDEHIRAWDLDDPYIGWGDGLLDVAKSEPSAFVRLRLASVAQKSSNGWPILEALAKRSEDKDDRNIPKLLYQSIAQRMTNEAGIRKGLEIARTTPIPQLADWIHWYAATRKETPMNDLLARLTDTHSKGAEQTRMLAALAHAFEGRADRPSTTVWNTTAHRLYRESDPKVVRLAERVGAALGDRTRFATLRETLSKGDAPAEDRKHAFAVLTRAQDAESLPVFLQLVDDAAFRAQIIPQLARFNSPEIARTLISRFGGMKPAERSAAFNVLTGRPAYALALLDAVQKGEIARDQVTSFHVRAIAQLNNAEVSKRAAAVLGRVGNTNAEKQKLIGTMEKTFDEAPLWAYSANAGREHFRQLCATCHKLNEDGARIGPDLTGAGKHGIRYYLENVIDPNAVVGLDFQMTTVQTKDGETVSGLVVNETDSAVTLRTTNDQVVITKADISKRALSESSLMPEGLLEALPDRERLELLKFLTSN